MNPRRSRLLADGSPGQGPVVYWMSRDQRIRDNWALALAQDIALRQQRPLTVVFCLVAGFLGAGLRQYRFMLGGLEELAADCRALNVSFRLLTGNPEERIPAFLDSLDAGWLVTDFDPLRLKRAWKTAVLEAVSIPAYEVDAHNLVPCWVASGKREFAARTLRPKLQRSLSEFLEPLPETVAHPYGREARVDQWERRSLLAELRLDASAAALARPIPGPAAAKRALEAFIHERLPRYAEKRNDPNAGAVSGLSPYFHFGHLAPQRALLEVGRAAEERGLTGQREAFFEEALVRRELAENFCFSTPRYDALDGLPDWGRETLERHRQDPREPVYAFEDFENAATHDPLWNAAQTELLRSGSMHGYLRMYWAKKILEWTASPEEALETALRLNDRYELDGRDPNGYTGVLWSIGGLHDRPFAEREVFGKVRFMSFAGCKRKFDVEAYIQRWTGFGPEDA